MGIIGHVLRTMHKLNEVSILTVCDAAQGQGAEGEIWNNLHARCTSSL